MALPSRPALLISFLAITVLAPATRAQESTGTSVGFGVGGGGSIPVGESKEALRAGFHVQSFVRVEFGKSPVAVRGDFSYENFDLSAAVAGSSAKIPGGAATLLGGLAQAQTYLRRTGVRPYVLLGVGGYRLQAEFDDPEVPSRSERGLSADAGGGVAFTLGGFNAYAESRFEHLFSSGEALNLDAVRIVEITFGVVF